jgi:hypothetical protein
LSGTPLVISLDGRRAAVFADRAPPSPIIRDFFVMNAAGRKITLLPELIYLGRRQAAIYLSAGKETADAAAAANITSSPTGAPFESGHV